MKEFRLPRSGEIYSFLSRRANGIKQYGDEIVFRPCPKCSKDNRHNPCGKINAKSGLWRCWACGATGGMYSLTKYFGEPLQDPYTSQIWEPNKNLVSQFHTQVRRPITGNHYPELLNYCIERGIGEDTLNAWRITSKGNNNIRFPIYDWIDDRWVLVNSKIRCIDPESKNKEWFEFAGGPTKLLVGNHLIQYDGPKRAIITEGQFDAMVGYELGLRNIFSIPNGSNHVDVGSMLRFIPDDWDIWVASDMDSAGDLAYEQFLVKIGSEKCKRLKMPHKDLNEWVLRDPSVTAQDIENHMCEHKLQMDFNCSGFLSVDFEIDYSSQRKLVCKTPLPALNEMLGGGLWVGQTTGMLAPSGAGKTSFVNHFGIYCADQGTRTGLISLEGTRSSLMNNLKTIIMSLSDDPRKTADHLKLSPLSGPQVTVEEVKETIERMLEMDISLIILDNLDFICRNDQFKKSQVYCDIVNLIVKSNAHLVSVWQPNKIDRYQKINSGNQKGFSQFYQDSDNYWVLNKDKDNVTLDIEKNREYGIVDKSISMKYDSQTKMFSQTDFVSKATVKCLDFLEVSFG